MMYIEGCGCRPRSVYVCIYVCMCVYKYTMMYIEGCGCRPRSVYVCIYVCMYVCI